MQIRLKYTIKISHFSIIIEKGNSKKKYKKVKIGYDKVKIKYRIKTRLPSKVKVFNFRGDQSPLVPSPGSTPGSYGCITVGVPEMLSVQLLV